MLRGAHRGHLPYCLAWLGVKEKKERVEEEWALTCKFYGSMPMLISKSDHGQPVLSSQTTEIVNLHRFLVIRYNTSSFIVKGHNSKRDTILHWF